MFSRSEVPYWVVHKSCDSKPRKPKYRMPRVIPDTPGTARIHTPTGAPSGYRTLASYYHTEVKTYHNGGAIMSHTRSFIGVIKRQ